MPIECPDDANRVSKSRLSGTRKKKRKFKIGHKQPHIVSRCLVSAYTLKHQSFPKGKATRLASTLEGCEIPHSFKSQRTGEA